MFGGSRELRSSIQFGSLRGKSVKIWNFGFKLVLITCVHPESSLRSFDVARTSKCLFFNILGIKCNEMQNELYYFSLCLSPCQRLSAVHGAVYAMQQAFNEVAPMCVDVFHRIPKPNNVA